MAKSFLLVVTDRDKGQFTVEGPMSDDGPWNDAVWEAQAAGRHVKCHTPGEGTKAQVALSMEAEFGLVQVTPGSIVGPKFF